MLCLAAVILYIASPFKNPENIFLQHLKTTIQFSKEVSHIIDKWVKFWHVFIVSLTFLNLKSPPTLIWELHLLISCDHRLATDNKSLTKINKSILWESIGCVEFTTENIICFIIGYKLYYLYHISIIFIINLGMHRYTHIGFVARRLLTFIAHSCLKRAGSFQPPGFCGWSLHLKQFSFFFTLPLIFTHSLIFSLNVTSSKDFLNSPKTKWVLPIMHIFLVILALIIVKCWILWWLIISFHQKYVSVPLQGWPIFFVIESLEPKTVPWKY